VNASGFNIVQGVFSGEERNHLLAALSRPAVKRGRAGARHLMTHPEIFRVAADKRLLQLARQELGCDAVPFRATLFDKSDRANWLVVWHQDTALPLEHRFDAPGWGPWSLKAGIHYAHAPAWALSRIVALRVYIDDSTTQNGPLRVLPGSHTAGVLTDSEVFAWAAANTAMDCLVGCGGVMAMHPLLIHSSPKLRSAAPRRVLHIEYSDSRDLVEGVRLAIA